MFEWSEEHQMMRAAVRQFIEKEIVPDLDAYEHEGRPPYDVLRKMFATFGIDAAARAGFAKRLEREARPADDGRRTTSARRPLRPGHDPDPDHRVVPLLPGHGHRPRGVGRA